MDLSSYLSQAVSILKNDTFTIDGETVECVYNSSAHKYGDKKYGFPSGDNCSLTFNTTDFPTIKTYKGSAVFHKEQKYRIMEVQYGDTATTLLLEDFKKL